MTQYGFLCDVDIDVDFDDDTTRQKRLKVT